MKKKPKALNIQLLTPEKGFYSNSESKIMHMFLFSGLESGSTLFHLTLLSFSHSTYAYDLSVYHLQGTDREETGCEQFSNAPSLHSKICHVRITPSSAMVALMRESNAQYQILQHESDAQWYPLPPGPWKHHLAMPISVVDLFGMESLL